MNRVFIYATLKSKSVLEKALGTNHGKVMVPTIAHGYKETFIHHNHDVWPTLWTTGSRVSTKGDIINVTDDELAKLRAWENNYVLRPVQTEDGQALAFFFEPVRKVPMASVIRWRNR